MVISSFSDNRFGRIGQQFPFGDDDNVVSMILLCDALFWPVTVNICRSSGVVRVVERAQRPIDGEPAFCVPCVPFLNNKFGGLYHTFTRGRYDRIVEENRRAYNERFGEEDVVGMVEDTSASVAIIED